MKVMKVMEVTEELGCAFLVGFSSLHHSTRSVPEQRP